MRDKNLHLESGYTHTTWRNIAKTSVVLVRCFVLLVLVIVIYLAKPCILVLVLVIYLVATVL